MSPKIPHSIGERLIYAREHRGMSAADLRRRLAENGVRISRSRLWNYENRPDSVPKPEILGAIAELTGFNPGWLLTGTGGVMDAGSLTELLGADTASNALDEQVALEDGLGALLRGWRQLNRPQREAVLKVIELLIEGQGSCSS